MKSLILILLLASSSVFAQSKQDGNEMLEKMKASEFADPFYIGYITGVATFLACMPAKTTQGQVYDVVKVYLEQNPAIRHESQSSLVYKALANTYPCKQEPQTKGKKPV